MKAIKLSNTRRIPPNVTLAFVHTLNWVTEDKKSIQINNEYLIMAWSDFGSWVNALFPFQLTNKIRMFKERVHTHTPSILDILTCIFNKWLYADENFCLLTWSSERRKGKKGRRWSCLNNG